MSLASSSSSFRSITGRRTINALAQSARFASTSTHENSNSTSYYQPQPYSPRSRIDYDTPQRPPRPATETHFSGRPTTTRELNVLDEMLRQTHADLRSHYLHPLPKDLTVPNIPEVRWLPRQEMRSIFGAVIRHSQHQRVAEILNELHRASFIAELGGKTGLAQSIASFLSKYSKGEVLLTRKAKKEKKLDEHGRAFGAGRRKTASARVWIIPSKAAIEYLESAKPSAAVSDSTPQPAFGQEEAKKESEEQVVPDIPTAEVLVNQMSLPKYFYKLSDRQSLLRPLRLTGLLGAYNVFALVEGGGLTGQAEAIALGLARALVVMRPETKDVLYADGALMRNPKMVERKKTNLLKARKARAWVKR